MVNDTNTLNGALMELGETLASNLSNMGVNANANNGLTTLAEKILDINNFQNGLFIKTNDTITQTGDTLWIIAIPLNNNKLLSEKNETVDFYLNGNTLIDSVSTDNWGIASTTLTGAGVGECIIHAEYNGEASEQINFFDYIKYDKGTLSDHNDNVWTSTNLITRYDEYSIITSNSNALSYISISGNIVIEVDVMTNQLVTAQLGRIANVGTSLLTFSLSSLGLTREEWHHLKIEINNNYCTISNTENTNTVTGDVTGFNMFGLRMNANYNTYFKNVKVYNKV